MKGESWNTISIIGCLKNSLTLVLSILISIHHSAERFQRTFLSNEPLKPETSISNFKLSINKNWKRNHDRRNGREYFQFNVSSISPLVDASSNRTHFHSCLSFNRAFHDRATETRRAQIRVVHVSFTSIIWRSVRLRESTIASNHAPIAIPMEKQLTSVDRVRFINRGKLYTRSLKRKYGEIISRRHRCRINNSPTRVSSVSGENCNR